MTNPHLRERAARLAREPAALAMLALTALFAAPIVLNAHLPLQDVSYHLEMVELWRRVSAGDPFTTTHYALREGWAPYLTYYWSLRALGALVSVELANRLVLLAYVVATPWAFAWMLEKLGLDWRWAVASFAVLVSTPLVYGFVPNALGVPIVFALLGGLAAQLERPRLAREALMALGVVALYLTHVSGAMLFAVTGPVVLLARARSFTHFARNSIFTYPGILVALVWSRANLAGDAFRSKPQTFANAIEAIPRWTNRIGLETDALALLALVVLATAGGWLRARRARPEEPSDEGGAPARSGFDLHAAALSAWTLYFMLPVHILAPMYQWMTAARILSPAALMLAIPRARASGRAGRALLAVVTFACLAHGVSINQRWRAYDESVRGIDEVVDLIPPNQRVEAYFARTRMDGSIPNDLLSLPNLYTVRKPGLVSHSFAQHEAMPVKFVATPPKNAWKRSTKTWRPTRSAKHYDYVLVVGNPSKTPYALPKKGPALELVHHVDRFTLYRFVR